MKKLGLFILMLLIASVGYCADTKVSALTELATTPADSDELYINDGGTSKKIQYSNLMDGEALKDDSIKDTSVDWGTGANQVSASDMPDEDIGDITITSGVYTVDDGSIYDLTIDVKEENTSNITKGQAVYISGSAGAGQSLVGLIDNTDSTKIRALGLA